MNVNISENIKELRVALNMTQSDLAKTVHVTTATISAYENGIRMPSYDTLIKLASFFKVSTDSLLGYSDNFDSCISQLTPEQRKVIFEIIDLYKEKNQKEK